MTIDLQPVSKKILLAITNFDVCLDQTMLASQWIGLNCINPFQQKCLLILLKKTITLLPDIKAYHSKKSAIDHQRDWRFFLVFLLTQIDSSLSVQVISLRLGSQMSRLRQVTSEVLIFLDALSLGIIKLFFKFPTLIWGNYDVR